MWESLDVDRITLRNNSTQEESIVYLSSEQQKNDSYFHDAATGKRARERAREGVVQS